MTPTTPAPSGRGATVTLSSWASTRGITGERWTLSFAGRAVVTRATEQESRRYAREMGWVVVVGGQEL